VELLTVRTARPAAWVIAKTRLAAEPPPRFVAVALFFAGLSGLMVRRKDLWLLGTPPCPMTRTTASPGSSTSCAPNPRTADRVGGIGRVARTFRGAVGIASGVLRAGRRGGALSDGDLRSVEQLVTRLGELKGLPMKMGQILGFLDLNLPEDMRRLLGLLQTQSQSLPFATIERVIREDLGASAEVLLNAMEQEPASSASIGQVHRARLSGGVLVAVKTRHPDIEQAIRSDFAAAAAGTAFARLLMPGAGATAHEFVEEARARLIEGCDYRLEAQRQQLFGRLYRGHPDLIIPELLPDLCGPRVLTTRWEDGIAFESFAALASRAERDRAGKALFELYIGTLYRHGVFHADPHPGNYRFRSGGRVVGYDFGCVREYERPLVIAFADLADAVRLGDDAAIATALGRLGAVPPSDERAFARVRELLRSFFAPLLAPGVHSIDGRMAVDARMIAQDKLVIGRMRLPGRLLFLFRIRFGLYSVLARLESEQDWSALEQQFAAEARSPQL
jgi:predicted unusual protein kinase regulating ubiquinone biosynthesis (AarF/ABC1/UbiB family)